MVLILVVFILGSAIGVPVSENTVDDPVIVDGEEGSAEELETGDEKPDGTFLLEDAQDVIIREDNVDQDGAYFLWWIDLIVMIRLS